MHEGFLCTCREPVSGGGQYIGSDVGCGLVFPNTAANFSTSNLDRNNCWTNIDIDKGYCKINFW